MTDEWDDALAEETPNTTASNSDDSEPQPLFPSLEAWVQQWLAPMIRRPTSTDTCWCPQWWQHAEVISRLEALWRSWEHLRTDGTTGMSVWWRDHADPHLGFLLSRSTSPMSLCGRNDRGHVDEHAVLPVESAPQGWWGDTDQ